MPSPYELGTVEASEQILTDLYIDLRRKMSRWAAITHQTPQARVGYIGQHLTSVVTGIPGGRSGARGRDLVSTDGSHAEIKTCTKVDQLGSCRSCGQVAASIEITCSNCGSSDIDRKDDSKWLLGPATQADLDDYYTEAAFYLVLFEFADLHDPRQIDVRIWQVDPTSRGFAYCMVDYLYNIRPRSSSHAPFNLWPRSLKFSLMTGALIYSAHIDETDNIQTLIFPGVRGEEEPIVLHELPEYTPSTTLSVGAIRAVAAAMGLPSLRGSKREMLVELERVRREMPVSDATLSALVAEAVYGARIETLRAHLPASVRDPFAWPM